MKKILVAYDGHEAGHRALEMAARLAHAFGARVDVVSVVPVGLGGRDAPGPGNPPMEHARELVEARGILRDHGVEAGLIEPAGDPAETIERLATERGYDTIVVGSSRAVRRTASPGWRASRHTSLPTPGPMSSWPVVRWLPIGHSLR